MRGCLPGRKGMGTEGRGVERLWALCSTVQTAAWLSAFSEPASPSQCQHISPQEEMKHPEREREREGGGGGGC